MLIQAILISLLNIGTPAPAPQLCPIPDATLQPASVYCCISTDGLQCCASGLDLDTGGPQGCRCG